MYRYGEDVKGEKCWKDRGTGELKLLKHHDTGKIRVLLRVDKTRKIRLNHYLSQTLELNVSPTSDKAFTYFTTDYSDETPDVSTLTVKFKDPESKCYQIDSAYCNTDLSLIIAHLVDSIIRFLSRLHISQPGSMIRVLIRVPSAAANAFKEQWDAARAMIGNASAEDDDKAEEEV